MNYELKRGNTIIWSGKAEGKQSRVIMQADMVEVTIKSPVAIAFQKGDTIQVYGETYKLNRPENIAKQNTQIGYTYTIEFEALYYDLGKWILYTLDGQNKFTQPIVHLTSQARTILGLLVQNANRASSGWSLGVVDDTDEIQWSYNGAKLLTVLQDIADQTNLEFWVDGKTINLTRRQNDTGLSLAYGKGKGLYELSRTRREDPIVTHLTIIGGSRNIPNGYGHRNIQPAGGNPMVNPTYTAGQDRVEAVQVFENIYPRLNAKVTATSAINVIRSTDLDFDLNEHESEKGGAPQIAFTSGSSGGLLGQGPFEIMAYTHENRQIVFKKIESDGAYDGIPNELLKPSVGDSFVLLNINMPQSYVDQAEARVRELGEQYFAEEGVEQYEWAGRLTPKFVLENNVELTLGGLVNLQAPDIGFSGKIRVDSYTRDLQQEYLYEFTLSNVITINKLVRERNTTDRLASTVSQGLSPDGLSSKSSYAERAGFATTAGHANTATNAATAERADHATDADNALRANYADEADHALRADHALEADHADTADYAYDSDKWDGYQFADYLDQPVRKQDSPAFTGIISPDFASGFFGHGFSIARDGNGKYMAEFDRLTVRNDFNVYELVVNQLRATNGSLIVSDGIKITGANESGENYVCTIDTDRGTIGVPFRTDDILQTQVYNGKDMKYFVARVLAVTSSSFTVAILDGSGIPADGDDLVRIDNFTDNNRKGVVYITASDSGAPYIDTVYGMWTDKANSVRVRMGNLSGIRSALHGQLSGYGIFLNNAYIENARVEGTLIARAGSNVDTKDEAGERVKNAVDGIELGGTNLVRNSSTVYSSEDYRVLAQTLSERIVIGQEYTITIWGEAPQGVSFGLWDNSGTNNQAVLTKISDGVYRGKFKPENWSGNLVIFSIYQLPQPTAARMVTVRKIKIEKGNKGSDWTPSPFDIDASIQTVRSESVSQFSVLKDEISQKVSQENFNHLGERIGSAESSLSTQAGQIAAHSESIDNVTGRISSAEAKITPDAINLSVSSQVDRKVRNVEVGARNLVRQSATVYQSTDYKVSAQTLTERLLQSQEYTATIWGSVAEGVNFVLFDDRANNVQVPFLKVQDGVFRGTFNPSGWDGNLSVFSVYQYPAPTSPRLSTISKIKIEKGNKGTDWTPAPEDVDEDMAIRPTEAQMRASITLTKQGLTVFGQRHSFNGLVEFGSLDENAQSRINNAQSAADSANGNAAAAQATANAAAGAASQAQSEANAANSLINGWRKPNTTLINGDVIDTDTLIARQMKTSKGANRLSINEGSDNTIKVRHTNGQVGIVMGLVAGQPTMTFYDNTGRKLWEAGQAGLVYVNTVAESWTTLQMFMVQSIGSINDSLDVYNAGWQISAGMHREGQGGQGSVLSPYGTTRHIYSEGINGSSASNKQYAGYHTDQTKSTSNWIPNGWYIDGNVVMMQSGGYNVWETYAYKIFNGQLTGDSMIVSDIQWSDGW